MIIRKMRKADLAQIKEKGYTSVDLIVDADNMGARKLYEKLGFSVRSHGLAKKL